MLDAITSWVEVGDGRRMLNLRIYVARRVFQHRLNAAVSAGEDIDFCRADETTHRYFLGRLSKE